MSDAKRDVELLVIGGGPGGYPAAFHAADHGKKVLLVDADPKLGGVCANRGCIPSKALLHVAKLIQEAKEAADWGIAFGTPSIDLAKLRSLIQSKVVGKLNMGIAGLCRARGVEVLSGTRAAFLDAHTVELTGATTETVRFKQAIIATGSVPAIPKSFALVDPRIMDSTVALQLPDIPPRLLIVGGGYIGLEIGTVYAALGSAVTVVEFTDGLLPTADRDLVKPLEDRLKKKFAAIYLNTKVALLTPTPEGIVATLEGPEVPGQMTFDRVLVAVGRRPNTHGLGLEKTAIATNARGFIPVNAQRQTAEQHIFAVGDVAGDPGLAHKATAEAKVAVDAILGEPVVFEPQAIPAVIFTDPEIAWAGLTEREAKEKNITYERHAFPWLASGRATTLLRNDGLTKVLVEPTTQRILGVGIVGVGAGELISEAVLAIEMGAIARDLALCIHPHPTLSESLMEGAEMVLGTATHVGKPRRRDRS